MVTLLGLICFLPPCLYTGVEQYCNILYSGCNSLRNIILNRFFFVVVFDIGLSELSYQLINYTIFLYTIIIENNYHVTHVSVNDHVATANIHLDHVITANIHLDHVVTANIHLSVDEHLV